MVSSESEVALIVLVFALVSLPITALMLWKLLPEVRLLTLLSAWLWSVAALICVAVAAMAEVDQLGVTAAARSSLHYLSATMLLAPMTAVLGARRPGANAWPWFVVLPLILVLQWPSLSQLVNSSGREAIEIGTPAVLGALLVLLMGFGNYFGTRNTLSAALTAGAMICSLLPVSGWVSSDSIIPLFTSPLIAAASVLAVRRVNQLRALPTTTAREAADRLWLTFRDFYGIVWAKRVMDRVNQFASRERWGTRLTLDGYSDSDPLQPETMSVGSGTSESRTATPGMPGADVSDLPERPIAVLCWILKRFSSSAWMTAILGEWHLTTPELPDS